MITFLLIDLNNEMLHLKLKLCFISKNIQKQNKQKRLKKKYKQYDKISKTSDSRPIISTDECICYHLNITHLFSCFFPHLFLSIGEELEPHGNCLTKHPSIKRQVYDSLGESIRFQPQPSNSPAVTTVSMSV